MQISLAPIESLNFNEDEESLSVLYENGWLRIMLVKCRSTPEQFSIDVEFSMPAIEENSNFDAHLVLTICLKYLRYIQRLYDHGFLLEVIGQDWLWIASKSFSEPPSLEIFGYLIPPSIENLNP
ncbi:MAG: hypothetical protein P1Q69_18240 [Candidatus Thorarchaeota archaeon]|nr:hypothetical protein [Candidatus Thorarchaeota archaeon]